MDGVNSQPGDLKDELRTALKWIIGTFRAMRVEELDCALDLAPETKDNLALLLGSFIRIEPQSREIMLVHASAREYLLSPEADLVDTTSESDQTRLIPVHEEILSRCRQD